MSEPCIFCAIIDGEAESSLAYADDKVIAIMDLRPVRPGHTLVIPRTHAVGLEDLDEAMSSHAWRIGHRVGRALRRTGLRCEGVNLFVADGAPAGQEVFHFHLHVIPRYPGDGFRIDADWGSPDRDALERDADAIRSALVGLDHS
ncbi:MAG: HIT family protein [Nocardioidaceae bacterium]